MSDDPEWKGSRAVVLWHQRPTSSKEERFELAMQSVSEGMAMRMACRVHKITSRDVYHLLDTSESHRQRYAQARRLQLDALADDILILADNRGGDWYRDEDGNLREAPQTVNRAKVQIEARKWLLGKYAPKRFGDKVLHGIEAPDTATESIGIRISFAAPVKKEDDDDSED